MTILESLKENVLENFPNQIVYPNKTQDLLAYCEKNVDLITEAYELDLAEGSDRHSSDGHCDSGNLWPSYPGRDL